MTEYQLLWDELADLQKRFEEKAFPLVPLYHDLIWSPDMEGWAEKEYVAFRFANSARQDFDVEEWELWPKAIACSRFYGNSFLQKTRLVDFRNLAARAYQVLCSFFDLKQGGYSVPDGFRLDLTGLLSKEKSKEQGNASYFGWLELISECALYSPTIRLSANNGWWNYQGRPNETENEPIIYHKTKVAKGRSFRTHPAYISLHIDLAEASAEFIKYCMESDSFVQIGNGLFPICLPDEPETPFWDEQKGELWFQERLIKKYKKPAPNQRKLLLAFEASGWQRKILNPFRNETISPSKMDNLLKRTVEDLNKVLPSDAGFIFGGPLGGYFGTWTET